MVAVEIDEINSDGNSNLIENNQNQIPVEGRKILHSLASNWDDVADPETLQVLQLKGAMTNQVYQIDWLTNLGSQSRKVLLRIYGEGVDVFFNRDDEIRTFECMSRHGQGPRLLGRFSNGRVEEFIHARTLSAADLHDIEISTLIAAKLREFHDLDMPGPKNAHLWQRLRSWLETAQEVCFPEEAKQFQLEIMAEEIDNLEKKLSHDNQPIGFCHNDLQYGNIMIEEETKAVTIIDYEYATFNPVAYDLANHFCEMAADYHSDTPHILDFNKYPDFEKRKQFVQKYLNTKGGQASGQDAEVLLLDVEQLLQDVEKYTLASHLIWGLWGIISEHVNEIDFNYVEYAKQRFQQYWLKKAIILGSSN
ncbi:hypothetical protein H6P81_001370 [Aristolochia fimbriata]|uniref:Choline kinase 2 n=1 Tax=Aristolochia fimbriata TaxID=158543 RepID=A0AAV7F6U0_ARIFI|nr:hypothetical protein H6P81_001370 [Aristolochia fimbriata]